MEKHGKSHGHSSKRRSKRKLSDDFYVKLFVLLGVAILILSVYNLSQGASFGKQYDMKVSEAMENARPAAIQIFTITDSACSDCFSIKETYDGLKSAGYNITEETNLKLRSEEARSLISDYGIKKIPTIIVFGELEKTGIRNMESVDDALVFTQSRPPYTDAKTDEIMGRVSAVSIVDASCDSCFEVGGLISALESANVRISSEQAVDKSSARGQSLIAQYGIDSLPALIISEEFSAYSSEVINLWSQVGYRASDGSYVTRIRTPPYVNVTTDEVVGLVTMLVVDDESCEECYDAAALHKPILQGLGVIIQDEKSFDITSEEGKALVDMYDIEKVPTFVLTGDPAAYPALTAAWTDVGSVEGDGSYVFRGMSVIGQVYRDLTTGEVVTP